MKKRPIGKKHRNLTLRGGVIYYERLVNGRRYRISTMTFDWTEAASVRDLYEQRKGIGGALFYAGEVPRFAEFADRYMAEDTAHLAPSTRRDRGGYLARGERLVDFFGGRKLDEIDGPLIRAFWNQEV
ncbi:MAG: hypothetical protein ACYSUN_13060, partial [Planctomycetota bacterium]